MRVFGLVMAISLTPAAAALAQPTGRFVEPTPVNFDRPFQYDGVKAQNLPTRPAEPIPIEAWLANGRKVEGLRSQPTPVDPRSIEMRELFKDVLPSIVETPEPERQPRRNR